jgi:hypothetical protein
MKYNFLNILHGELLLDFIGIRTFNICLQLRIGWHLRFENLFFVSALSLPSPPLFHPTRFWGGYNTAWVERGEERAKKLIQFSIPKCEVQYDAKNLKL